MPLPTAQAVLGTPSARIRRVAGCMTGTSLDGIDCALIEVAGTGLAMKPRFIRGRSTSLGDLAPRLRALAEQKPMTAGDIAKLSRDFALLHAREISTLLGNEECDLIAVHGQTVFHAPPVSWQVFNPAVLAHETGIDVVCDLRAADLAAGGQGAPITPLADWVWLRSVSERRVILNLGGFANATILPRDTGPESIAQIRGMDICACNHILDGVARVALNKPYDKDGAAAAAGTISTSARDELLVILSRQAAGGRSLGTGDEVLSAGGWIERHKVRLQPRDLCATACAAVGGAIGQSLAEFARSPSGAISRVLLAGGGGANRTLHRAITESLSAANPSVRVEATDAHGLPGAFREAAEMAVLGALCQDRVPITLPAVTGVMGEASPAPIAGVWAMWSRGGPTGSAGFR